MAALEVNVFVRQVQPNAGRCRVHSDQKPIPSVFHPPISRPPPLLK
jgi:hypothetical protein